jgi:hypothetical protein
VDLLVLSDLRHLVDLLVLLVQELCYLHLLVLSDLMGLQLCYLHLMGL